MPSLAAAHQGSRKAMKATPGLAEPVGVAQRQRGQRAVPLGHEEWEQALEAGVREHHAQLVAEQEAAWAAQGKRNNPLLPPPGETEQHRQHQRHAPPSVLTRLLAFCVHFTKLAVEQPMSFQVYDIHSEAWLTAKVTFSFSGMSWTMHSSQTSFIVFTCLVIEAVHSYISESYLHGKYLLIGMFLGLPLNWPPGEPAVLGCKKG
jgi:hypothetical protein